MSRAPDERRSPWLIALPLVSLVLGLGALAWMLHHTGLDTVRIGLGLVGWWFGVMLLAYLASMVASALTLRYCAGREGAKVPFTLYVRATLAGHAINEATPLGKLGEVTKFTMLDERMPQARAASALILQNFVSFIVGCALIAASPAIAWLFFDVSPELMVTLLIGGAVFLVAGAGAFLIFWLGVGSWPFALLRRLGVGKKRVDRWQKKWRRVADEWREAARDGPAMRIAFATNLAARAIALAEPFIALELLGVDQPLAAAFLSSTGYQVVNWLTSFVPMQAGTAEAGAYGIFSGLGLPPGAGVLLELLRKVRRVTFIALGVSLLGWSNFRDLKRDASVRKRLRQKERAARAAAAQTDG